MKFGRMLKKAMYGCVNAAAVMLVIQTANSACMWLVHQPEFPKEANMRRKITRAMGLFATVGMLLAVSMVTTMATTTEFFKGLTLYNDSSYHYTPNFYTASSSAAPYVKYDCVYTEGEYYIGSQYKSGTSYVTIDSNKYYCYNVLRVEL